MSAAVLQHLAGVIPPGRILERPEHLAAYESDGLTAFRTHPLAVAVPEITPVLPERLSPAGSDPADTDHVSGAVPPDDARVML